MGRLRIATRSSRQATTQANVVADRLRSDGHEVDLVFIETYGDQTQAAEIPLHTIGGQGVFVKAVQQAVLDGRADLAVHSAKDLPTVPMPGLVIGAFTARRNPSDALVGQRLADLAPGATVATGSVRRRAQLALARPDLRFAELRGNIDTRLSKLPAEGAVVVAAAALELLGLVDQIAEVLDPTRFVPAVGQGCVAVEHRTEDPAVASAVARLDDAATRHSVEVERAFLAELGTGCSAPVAAFADAQQVLWTFLAPESSGAGDPNKDDEDGGSAVTKRLELSGDPIADQRLAATAARESMRELANG